MNNVPKESLVVELDASTSRWLRAFAEANCGSMIYHEVTPEHILAMAAACIADYAGRREGSWEANVARTFTLASGYHENLSSEQSEHLRDLDRRSASAN